MRAVVLAVLLALPLPASAQDGDRTLADVRQDLSVLYVELQRLRRELSTTGAPGVQVQGTGLIERVDGIERELQRLTADVEETRAMVERVVEDGTNRVGDLEFRLVELEGGDVSALGETTTLGGVDIERRPPPAEQGGAVELAVGEKAEFDAGIAAYEAGDYELAASRLGGLVEAYPGTPLAGEALYVRGEALAELGRTSQAARSYLDSYSGQPDGPYAPDALLSLGLSLQSLGQSAEACITLEEVTMRFPGAQASIEAQAARADFGCR